MYPSQQFDSILKGHEYPTMIIIIEKNKSSILK